MEENLITATDGNKSLCNFNKLPEHEEEKRSVTTGERNCPIRGEYVNKLWLLFQKCKTSRVDVANI